MSDRVQKSILMPLFSNNKENPFVGEKYHNTVSPKRKYSQSRGARGKVDQLNAGFGAPPTFHLALLSFEYSARQKCILSFGGDCIYGRSLIDSICLSCRPQTSTALLESLGFSGGNINELNLDGMSALHLACQKEDIGKTQEKKI